MKGFQQPPAPDITRLNHYSYQVLQFPTLTLSPGPIVSPSYWQGHSDTGTQRFSSFRNWPFGHWHPATQSSLHVISPRDKSRQVRAHDNPHSMNTSPWFLHCCARLKDAYERYIGPSLSMHDLKLIGFRNSRKSSGVAWPIRQRLFYGQGISMGKEVFMPRGYSCILIQHY
jgi:hypothetical protein